MSSGKQELAREIFKVSHLTGQFTLRSGQTSNEYFDKYRFEAQPKLLQKIAIHMSKLIPPGTEVLAGLEMGGLPLATALSMQTGLPCAFIRKEAKTYGTCQIAEGTDIKNKKICLVEDVITTGGQVIISGGQLREMGCEILGVICVIHRGSGVEPKLEEKGLKMKALFTMAELKAQT